VAQAAPGRARYQPALAVAAQGAAVVCRDEQTAMQARQRVRPPQAAAPDWPVHGADRSQRMGAVQWCGALGVASGVTGARTRTGTKCADFPACLLALFRSALGAGLAVVPLLLEHGLTHAPQQVGTWMASLDLSFAVKIDGLPTQARGLDQVDMLLSKVQRDVLTPNALPSTPA